MNKLWISAVAVVFGIASVKTILMARLFLSADMINVPTITGLFALFSILTGAVAYFAVRQLKAFLERQHSERLAPGGGETASKEEIIRRYAREWGLSKAELDVAVFAAKGFSNTEIADMRGSTVATIKTQLGKIYQKSDLENRYQLMAFVTDEVCVMAGKAPDAGPIQAPITRETQSVNASVVLPMVRKHKALVHEGLLKHKLSTG